MKHIRKYRILFTALLILVLYAILHFSVFSSSGKSAGSFSDFCNTLFQEEVSSTTVNLHYTLKNPKSAGIDSYEITLGSLSGRSPKLQKKELDSLSDQLKKFSYSRLSDKQKTTYSLLSDYIKRQQALTAYPYYDDPLSPSAGVTSQLPVLLAEYPFYTKTDVDNYLVLLSQMDSYFSGILDYEQKKADAGLFMSDSACMKVLDSCEVFTEHPDDNFLIETFAGRLDSLNELTDSQKDSYCEKNKSAIKEHVIPAYTQMIFGLTSLLGRGKNDWGMCYYKDGKGYYEALVSSVTGCDDSVDSLFKQIASARKKDLSVCTDLLVKKPELLSEEPKLNAKLNNENAMLASLQKSIRKDFPKPPETECEICHVDSALSEFLAPAFYITAPIDDISHNRIYINDAKNYSDIYYFTTLAHESYPGHLYQTISTAAYGLPPVHSLFDYPGFTEGWATYVEMQTFYYAGLDKKLASLLQHNQAATLSLYATSDIGIHYYGWKEKELTAFWNKYGVTDEQTIREIKEQILGEPGNYLKYYVGYLKFRQLREQYEKKYGDKFDAVAFHEAILRTGPSPFPILEQEVARLYP